MFGKVIIKRRYLQVGILMLLVALMAQAGLQTGSQGAKSDTAVSNMRPAAVSGASTSASSGAVAEAPVVSAGENGVLVGRSVKNDVSPPLRDIKPLPAEQWTVVREMPEPKGEATAKDGSAAKGEDLVVQRDFGAGALAMPAPLQNFAGLGNRNGVYPPDTNGDVGPNHYVQAVNLSYQIFSKSGASLYGPANGNTIWSGFGGACETQNAGDPIVLYDQFADRWLMSQFTSSAPYGECIAISTTADPTGSYYRYFFQHSNTVFYDYPHLGVWPDGYYAGFNKFGNVFYEGPSAIVYDRARMLQGLPATYQEKQLSTSYGTLQPADVDGPNLPPAGSPGLFVSRGSSALNLFKFRVDWNTPANSTITVSSLPVAAYTQLCSGTRSCIPQPGTTVKLDGIGDRVLHRLAYRNFASHEAMVITHNVDAGSGRAGVRWYEIRNPNSAPAIYQQGTYAPADGINRWMASAAMDSQGNIAMGYSVSSSTVYPGIRYTGRLAGDTLGQMAQGETELIAGSGSQTGSGSRWGDYSMMSVDPTDDCTFWYTTEYMAATGTAPWSTRIGSFKFPGCSGDPVPTPTPAPLPTATPAPDPNADFTLSASPTSRTVTRGNGTTYTVTLTSLNGFAGNVNLSVSGLPGRTTATFNPNPATLTSGGTTESILTVTTQRKSPTGTYTLTITGTGGGKTHSQDVTLVVSP